MIKIGVEVLFWIPNKSSGVQTVLLERLKALKTLADKPNYELYLFCNSLSYNFFRKEGYNKYFKLIKLGFNGKNKVNYFFQLLFLLPLSISFYRIKKCIFFNYYGPIPFSNLFCKNYTVVHDANFKNAKGTFGKKIKFIRYLLTKMAIKNSETVITVSEFSKKELSAIFPKDSQKIVVLYNGFKQLNYCLERDRLHNYKYIFSVGSTHVHKNFRSLIKAYGALRNEFREEDIKLVIAGQPKNDEHYIKQEIKDLGLEKDVIRLGYVSDEELANLYENALLFCFPSNYEGFGIPILEAMGKKVPVIANNVCSIPEIMGNGGILVDCNNIEHFSKAILLLIKSLELRKELITKGLKRVNEFSWSKSNDKFLELIVGKKQRFFKF